MTRSGDGSEHNTVQGNWKVVVLQAHGLEQSLFINIMGNLFINIMG